MIKEALQHLERSFASTIHSVHGRAYTRDNNGNVQALPSPKSMAETLEFHSLSGLVDYLASGHDGEAELALVVDSPTKVRLVGKLVGEFRQREVLAAASPYVSDPFAFGRHLDIETFVTQAQACFADDLDRAAVLKIVGNITQEEVAAVSDDGVSQAVVARAGIAKVVKVAVPNPVKLRPYRTFPEVTQPESKYVLRMKPSTGGLPSAALFEVGDGMWRGEAVSAIASRLGELLDGAGVKVSVFA